MDRKNRLCNMITQNTDWLMDTDSYETIPYYELSRSDFNTAKNNFAGGANYDDVVCLISTSIWSTGTSGILFTTDRVYVKPWAILGLSNSYRYLYSDYSRADFGNPMDFDEDRMTELMNALHNINKKVDRENMIDNIDATVDLGSQIIEGINKFFGNIAESNNEKIVDQLQNLSTDDSAIDEIYSDISNAVDEFNNELNSNDPHTLTTLNQILIQLFNQANHYYEYEFEDDNEFEEFSNWISFWSLLFMGGDAFSDVYGAGIYSDAPNDWENVFTLTDCIINEAHLGESFSDTARKFSSLVQKTNEKMMYLFEEDEDEIEAGLEEIMKQYNSAIYGLLNRLDIITDCISEIA